MSLAINYKIFLRQPDAHLLDVELVVSEPNPSGQQLFLPTWIPGSYLIREFSRQIVSIEAVNAAGELVDIQKLEKSTWQVAPVSGALTIRYQVYAFDESVRTAYFDRDRAFINPAAVCLAVVGQEDQPIALTVTPDHTSFFEGWQLATGLDYLDNQAAAWSFATLAAENYDQLVDCPIECGQLDILSFDACGTPHYMVISGGHYGDANRLIQDTKKICETQIRFFADAKDAPRAPYSRYLFLLYLTHDGYGGLEHRNSTALIASRGDMPAFDAEEQPNAGYQQLLGLISHEYFHNWNVKRLKPAAYAPYDLANEAYSRLLWAFEGITSYYDDLMLARSGVISEQLYIETLAKNMTATLRSPGARKQSLEDASFDAWIKYYRQDENSPNALASYYVKGGVFACLLDLTLRQEGKSLDDILLALWHRVGKFFDESGKGLQESEWESIALDVIGDTYQSFFDTHLRTPSDLITPLLDGLAFMGITTQLRPVESLADKGGKWVDAVKKPLPSIGMRLGADALGIKVQGVVNGGAGEAAGFHVGDIMIAIDGVKAVHSQLENVLTRLPLDKPVTIHAFRKEKLKTFNLQLRCPAADTVGLKVNQEEHADRKAWLFAK